MKIFITPASDKPMYEQVKDGIREAIYSGELKGNDLLPSVRQLAADLNVSMITTKRAYTDLEREGLIFSVSGKGTYIKTDTLDKVHEKHISDMLESLRTQLLEMKKASVKKEQVIEAVNIIYE